MKNTDLFPEAVTCGMATSVFGHRGTGGLEAVRLPGVLMSEGADAGKTPAENCREFCVRMKRFLA